MTTEERDKLSQMIDDLVVMRLSVYPKTNSNRLYLEYCVAISAIRFIRSDGDNK